MKNDPHQTTKPINKPLGRPKISYEPAKLSKTCNLEVSNMPKHLKTQKHLRNDCD